jgi:hypothetical protein
VAALVPDRNLIVVDHNNNDFGPLDASSAYAYGQYVGRRYRGKPIVWVLGWDVAPAGREAVFQAEADGIAEGAAGGDHSADKSRPSCRRDLDWVIPTPE